MSQRSWPPTTPTAGGVTLPMAEKSKAQPFTGWMPLPLWMLKYGSMTTSGEKDFLDCLNPFSLEVLTGCKVEAGLAQPKAEERFQFMRQGYFCADSKDSTPGHLVFNRAVSLKDSFKF